MSKAFYDLLAEDLMSWPVHVIPHKMPLREAAEVLARANLRGAPVVDGSGRCIGVLSATDFLHAAERPCEHSEWEVPEMETLPTDEVRRHMTRDIVTAPPSEPVRHLAAMMRDAHIQRVIITDPVGRPLGVVSASDIVAAVARLGELAGVAS